jgi:uncharacterized membrane protein YdjX (TVP38/TMEM64 family)
MKLDPLSLSPRQAPRRGLLRPLLLAALLVGATVAVSLSPIRAWLQDLPRIRQSLASLGVWAYPVCVLAVALLVGCGVPRLLLCAIGAMVLGFWRGLLLTQLAALLGYYAIFAAVRWGGRDWVLHRWPNLRRWADALHDQGIMGVILIRQFPLHGTLTNLCLGLSAVKHRHFILGTAIGLLPEAIPIALVGAGLVKASLKDSAGYIAAAALAFAVIWIASGYALRALRRSRSAAALSADLLSPAATGARD